MSAKSRSPTRAKHLLYSLPGVCSSLAREKKKVRSPVSFQGDSSLQSDCGSACKRSGIKALLLGLLVIAGLGWAGGSLLVSSPKAEAATSSYLNFQGRLLTSAGAVVADGNYHIEFKIYDTIGSGGSAQGVCSLDSTTDDCWWLETRSTGNLVRVVNGYFSVNLGSVTAFGASIPWDQQLYLTMRVGGSSGSPSWESAEMLSSGNRMVVTGVPYAFTAGKLQATSGSITNVLTFATPSASNKTLTLPNETGIVCSTGSICSGYQAATSSTLQNAYNTDGDGSDAIIALTTADDGIILRNPDTGGSDSTYILTLDQLEDDTGTMGGLSIQSAGTGNLLLITDTTATAADVLTIADGGTATFRTQTDSVTGFQVLDADGGTPVFNVDTTNERVGIGDASPDAIWEVESSAPALDMAYVNATSGTTTDGVDGLVIDFSQAADAGADTNIALNISATTTGDHASDILRALSISLTNSVAGGDVGSQYGIYLSNADHASNRTTEALIGLVNDEASANTVTDGLIISGTAGAGLDTIVDAIDVSDDNITNGLNLGTNFLVASSDSINDFTATNGGLAVVSNALSLDVTTSSTTATTSSNSGLELTSEGLRLLGGCTSGSSDILKWNGSVWGCSADGGGTLQAAYDADADGSDATITLSNEDDSIIISNPNDSANDTDSTFLFKIQQLLATGSQEGLVVESNGTGNLLRITDTTATAADVLTITDGGGTTFKSQTDSTTAFQIQNAAGNNYIAVDTSGSNLNLGTAAIAETVQIGTVSTNTGNTQTINIGNTAAAGTTNITLGAFTGATAGTTTIQSVGTMTLQTASGGAIAIKPGGTANITIGTSDTTGTLLVVDTDSNADISGGTEEGSNGPTQVDGAMFYSSTNHSFVCGVNGDWVSCGSTLLYSNTSVGSTVTNTVTETNFTPSYTIPAGYCTLGRVIRVTAFGSYDTDNTVGADLTIKIKAGSTELASTGAVPQDNLTSVRGWGAYITTICNSSPGASVTTETQGVHYTTVSTGVPSAVPIFKNGTTTLATNGSLTWQLSATWGAADTDNTITLREFIVEGLGP